MPQEQQPIHTAEILITASLLLGIVLLFFAPKYESMTSSQQFFSALQKAAILLFFILSLIALTAPYIKSLFFKGTNTPANLP